jgi:A/G-specific adenine glycosylase
VPVAAQFAPGMSHGSARDSVHGAVSPDAAAPDFARTLIAWHRDHGRHDLPWQNTRDPYRVWLSEIMLQQTQVRTVIGYYGRFLQRFANVRALAAAPLEQVLELWAGLGYYTRARMAHRCAQAVVAGGGQFPQTAAALAQLPGIGPSTAAAIAAFCFDERAAILDANVKRVLARRGAIEGDPRQAAVAQRLWEQAQALLPPAPDMPRYTQAIMDLGATVCTRARPHCAHCPVREGCQARIQGRTADLPSRSPAAPRPVRTAHLLVAVRGGSVLLEQRPPAGIWGGLLSLPEFASPAALRAHAGGLDRAAPAAMAGRRHGFTHFTFEFTPHLLQLEPPQPGAARRARATPPAPGARQQRWLALGEIDTAALPAPILALLREVRASLPTS